MNNDVIDLINERFKSLEANITSMRDEIKNYVDDGKEVKDCVNEIRKDQEELKKNVDKKIRFTLYLALGLFGAYAVVPQEALMKLIGIFTKLFGVGS